MIGEHLQIEDEDFCEYFDCPGLDICEDDECELDYEYLDDWWDS